MDTAKREALQTAGWRIGDAADFLGMSYESQPFKRAPKGAGLAKAVILRMAMRGTKIG